jgi:hypothetical protein
MIKKTHNLTRRSIKYHIDPKEKGWVFGRQYGRVHRKLSIPGAIQRIFLQLQ